MSNSMRRTVSTNPGSIVRLLLAVSLVVLSVGAMASPVSAKTPSKPAGAFQIEATGRSNLCVDVPGNDARSGVDLWVYDCNGTDAQRFVFGTVGGAQRIIHEPSQLCLDIEGNGRITADVQLSDCVGKSSRYHNAQAWYLNGSDIAAPGNRCLDSVGRHSAISRKTLLHVYTCGSAAKNWNLVSLSGSPAAQPPSGGSSDLVDRIVGSAHAELDRWTLSDGRHYEETDRWATSVLKEYYLTSRYEPWKDHKYRSNWKTAVPWSAAFISQVMSNAGATDFKFNPAHNFYVVDGKKNVGSNKTFQSHHPYLTTVKVGDLICSDRDKDRKVSYSNVRLGDKLHCDVVVKISGGKAHAIGGNTYHQNSTGKKVYRAHTVGYKYFNLLDGMVSGRGWVAILRPHTN